MRNSGIVGQQLARPPYAAALLAGSLTALLAGCPGGSNTPTIEFDSPRDGAMFTPDDDVDAELDGVQIEVLVATENLSDVRVGLLLNGEFVGEAEAEPSLSFEPTLVPGSNTLQLALKPSEGDWDTGGPEIEVFLTDSCGRVNFVSPMAPDDGDLLLGGDTFCKTDGRMIEVVVATPDVADGTDAQLVLGGNVYATEQVNGGTVTFADVELSTGSNDMYVSITAEDGGAACDDVAFPVSIDVDCEAPQCRITAPMTGGDTLTGADDISPTVPGLQLDVQVTTDAMANGQPVKLTIDGNEDGALTGEAGPDGSDIKATFRAVTLAEGRRTVRAQCADALGNTANAQAELDVDTQPCGIDIGTVTPMPSQPGNVLFTDSAPLSVTFNVEVDGDDCSELRSSIASTSDCANVGMGSPTALAPGPSETPQAQDLEAEGTAFLCAQVRDDAGNEAVAFFEVSLVTTAPRVVVNAPVGAPSPVVYTTASGPGIEDLDALTPECEVDLTVSCLDYLDAPITGETVTLYHADTDAVLGTATCDNGVATFSDATGNPAELPSDDTGVGYNIVAKVTDNGVEGVSMPFPVQPDCNAPVIDWPAVDRVCGSIFRPMADEPPDVDGDTDGYQTNDIVAVVPEQGSSDLYVQPAGDALSETPTANVAEPASENVMFEAVTLAGAQQLSLVACTTDPSGNRTCTDDSCEVTFADIKSVAIESLEDGDRLFVDLSGDGVGYRDTDGDDVGDPPAGGDTFVDCDPGAGLGVEVLASTNADNLLSTQFRLGGVQVATGSVVTGGGTTYPNSTTECVPLDANSPNVVLGVTVVDPTFTINPMDDVLVAVDTSAPAQVQNVVVDNADPIDGLPCRTAPVITWDNTASSDASFEGYEVRCDHAQITDEATWHAAEFRYEPGLGALTQELTGYRPGQDMYCYVRAYDQAGAYSPLSAELLVEPPGFEVAELDWPVFGDAPNSQISVGAVGDVDGDGNADFFVAGGGGYDLGLGGQPDVSGVGYLYFGQDSYGAGSPAPVTVRFEDATQPYVFAASIVPLGDVSGDGLDDFAFETESLSSPPLAADAPQVYLVLGRARADWPADVQLRVDAVDDADDINCGTDACLAVGGIRSLGLSMAGVGDFVTDSGGAAINDIGVSAGTGNDAFPHGMVLRGGQFTPIELGVDHGECFDLGDPTATPDYVAPPCAQDGVAPTEPDAVRLDYAELGLSWPMGSTGQGEILAASKAPASPLYMVRGVPYPDGTAGIVNHSEQVPTPAAPVEVFKDGSNASRPFDRIIAAGDLNGDQFQDYAVSTPRDMMFILFGTGSGESFEVDTTSLDVASLADTDPAAKDFPVSLRGLAPGETDALDFNGDGLGDLGLATGNFFLVDPTTDPGKADLLWGGTLEPGDNRVVSDLRVSGAMQPIAPRNDLDVYHRRIAPLGSVDGDGFSDFVVVEFDDADLSQGNLRLFGLCN